jgi:hypothetical protein
MKNRTRLTILATLLLLALFRFLTLLPAQPYARPERGIVKAREQENGQYLLIVKTPRGYYDVTTTATRYRRVSTGAPITFTRQGELATY